MSFFHCITVKCYAAGITLGVGWKWGISLKSVKKSSVLPYFECVQRESMFTACTNIWACALSLVIKPKDWWNSCSAWEFPIAGMCSKNKEKSKSEACAKHIDSWMVSNRLKLNQDKTEVLLISSRYRQSLALTHLQVDEEKICSSESVQNLGVHFDQHARMHVHVKKVCQASFYLLRNIRKIRRYLEARTLLKFWFMPT